DSLGLFLYREPKSAKNLHVGVIPKSVDEYWQFRAKIPEQALEQQLGNPAWHLLNATRVPAKAGTSGDEAPPPGTPAFAGDRLPRGAGDTLPVTYGLLLNLVGVLGAEAT